MLQGLKTMKRQWVELLTLAGSHMGVDIFGGMLAVLLPAIRDKYTLSLMLGVMLLSVQSLASNGVQLLTGHMRAHKKTVLFIPLGMLLACMLSLIGLIPQTPLAIIWVFALTAVSGTGIAIFHPEALRATHNLRLIPSATASAVFIMAGMLGISGGAWIATLLVTRWGFTGLLVLIPVPILFLILIKALGIQLANEEEVRNDQSQSRYHYLTIWKLYAMVLPAGMATTMIMSLLPTRLNELGYSLSYGGMGNMIIGCGGIVGSLVIARRVDRGSRGELFYATASWLVGAPLFLLYLIWMEHPAAIGFLFPVGFFAVSAYPLVVSMARYARGMTLGSRMGLILGGTWGGAHIVLLVISPWIERIGVQAVFNVAWLGYVLAGLIGIMLYRKESR
jgi:FSR family fosmidomycin resistance protein-like MFS transporter